MIFQGGLAVGLFNFMLRSLRRDAQGIIELGLGYHGVWGAIEFLTEAEFKRKGLDARLKPTDRVRQPVRQKVGRRFSGDVEGWE